MSSRIDLRLGDCLEIMPGIPDQSVDMVLADPPYGTTNCHWDSVIPLEPMWKELKRVIKLNGAIVLFGSEPFSSALRMSNIRNYKYDWKWDKITGTGHLVSKKQPLQKIEDICVFNAKNVYNPIKEVLSDNEFSKKISKISKKKSYISEKQILTPKRLELSIIDRKIDDYNTKYPSNVITISKFVSECNNINRLHPTQKPVALMEYLIKTYTNEDETVLDFCFGSGTTGVACKNLNRNFIGIEKEPAYFEIAKKRIYGESTINSTQPEGNHQCDLPF